MEELLNQVAEIRGMPASLVKRSAEARAEKEGMTLEAVLAEWAGVELPAEDAPPESEEPDPAEASSSSDAESVNETSGDESDIPKQVTTDYLIKLAADAKRMPPKLILSSARARADHSGTPLDEVLAGWAGVDLDELKEQVAAADATSPTSDDAARAEPESEPDSEPADAVEPTVPAAAAVVAGMGMDELLEKVAQAKGMPAALAKRSAEARAKKTGEPLEAVLAEWAGIDPATLASSEPAPEPAPVDELATAESSDPAQSDAGEEPVTDDDAPPSADDIEIIEAVAEDTEDGVEPSATKIGRYPAWLAAAFLIIPLLAVTYILISPNGPECGTSGQLLVDPVTGNAVNCDGSAYGTEAADYFGNGAAVYAQCQACHAADGSGGAGPAFTSGALLATFPAGSCSDQIEWIALGTSGWPDPTYGANAKPVGGVGLMPAFGATLDETQIAEVALYERVQFGGEDLAEAEADCGFGEDAEGDGATVEAAG